MCVEEVREWGKLKTLRETYGPYLYADPNGRRVAKIYLKCQLARVERIVREFEARIQSGTVATRPLSATVWRNYVRQIVRVAFGRCP